MLAWKGIALTEARKEKLMADRIYEQLQAKLMAQLEEINRESQAKLAREVDKRVEFLERRFEFLVTREGGGLSTDDFRIIKKAVLSVEETADILGYSKRAVYRMVKDGILDGVKARKRSSNLKILTSSIREFLTPEHERGACEKTLP